MAKMNAEYTAEHYFAALKLIEQLYKDGEIPAYMLRSILKDYADVVDLSKLAIFEEKEDGQSFCCASLLFCETRRRFIPAPIWAKCNLLQTICNYFFTQKRYNNIKRRDIL